MLDDSGLIVALSFFMLGGAILAVGYFLTVSLPSLRKINVEFGSLSVAFWVSITIAAIMLLAMLPMPYGYYQMMRLVVCGGAIYLAYKLWNEQQGWAVALGAVALLFNPLLPVQLSRDIWAPINLACATFFAVNAWRHRTLR